MPDDQRMLEVVTTRLTLDMESRPGTRRNRRRPGPWPPARHSRTHAHSTWLRPPLATRLRCDSETKKENHRLATSDCSAGLLRIRYARKSQDIEKWVSLRPWSLDWLSHSTWGFNTYHNLSFVFLRLTVWFESPSEALEDSHSMHFHKHPGLIYTWRILPVLAGQVIDRVTHAWPAFPPPSLTSWPAAFSSVVSAPWRKGCQENITANLSHVMTERESAKDTTRRLTIRYSGLGQVSTFIVSFSLSRSLALFLSVSHTLNYLSLRSSFFRFAHYALDELTISFNTVFPLTRSSNKSPSDSELLEQESLTVVYWYYLTFCLFDLFPVILISSFFFFFATFSLFPIFFLSSFITPSLLSIFIYLFIFFYLLFLS